MMKFFMKPSTCYTGIILLRKIYLKKPSKLKLAYVYLKIKQLSSPLYQQLLITKASENVLNEILSKHLPILCCLAVDEDQCQSTLKTLTR